MSNYNFKAKDKQTGEVLEFEAMDDYFGRHKYGYKRADTDNGIVWTEKEFNQDFERIDDDQNYTIERYIEFTEDEVRELASQLPLSHKIDLLDDCEWVNDNEPTKVSDCCGAEVERKKQQIPSISIYGMGVIEYRFTCKSCGEPCEAVEERKRKWQKVKDTMKPGSIEPVDTKPDPIEPLFKFPELRIDELKEEEFKQIVGDKINEIIERINLLSNHE